MFNQVIALEKILSKKKIHYIAIELVSSIFPENISICDDAGSECNFEEIRNIIYDYNNPTGLHIASKDLANNYLVSIDEEHTFISDEKKLYASVEYNNDHIKMNIVRATKDDSVYIHTYEYNFGEPGKFVGTSSYYNPETASKMIPCLVDIYSVVECEDDDEFEQTGLFADARENYALGSTTRLIEQIKTFEQEHNEAAKLKMGKK